MIKLTAIITSERYKEYREEWLAFVRGYGINEITNRTVEIMQDSKIVLMIPSFESWILDRMRKIHNDPTINDITVTYEERKYPEIVRVPRGSRVI